MALSFEKAKSYLHTGHEGEPSVYEHVNDVLLKMLQEQPKNGLACLENISLRVKQQRLVPNLLAEGVSIQDNAEHKAQIAESVSRVTSLLSSSSPDEAEQQTDESVIVPDLITESTMFEWSGVGFEREETLKLHLALHSLARTEPVSSVRLFGKVLGTEADYYIIEASATEPSEPSEELDAQQGEHPGKGANEFVYYVTNKLGDSWQRLADVLPQHIVVARQCRRLFTGRLDANVQGQPYFKWSEALLLRATIARIAAASIISPKGFYVSDSENEDSNVLIENEEFTAASTDTLLNPDGWVHHRAGLLNQGRVKPVVADEDEDDDDGDNNNNKDTNASNEVVEEALPLLRAISEDEHADMMWAFRVSTPVSKHSVCCARSVVWPGAVSVCKGAAFANLYIGDGLRQLTSAFRPPLPAKFQTEFGVSAATAADADDGDNNDDEAEDKQVLGSMQVDPLPPVVEAEAEAEDKAEAEVADDAEQ